MARVPVLARAGVARIVNGPITYTPDGNPLLGPAFGLPGLWLACGFSFGITQAGGAGQYLAEWIVEGQPSIDLWELDPRRYGAYATERYAVARCIDIYEDEYAIVYPQDDRRPGRPARTSPLYDRFRDAGAVFGVRNGWERPYWFAPAGTEPRDRPSFRRTNWFDAVGKEARAVRERAGCWSSRASRSTRSTVRARRRSSTGSARTGSRALGRIALSPLLTARGTIECDVTVTRLAPERFLVLSAAVAELHDLDWLRRHAPADGSVTIENVTARWGVLILAGPRARDVLGRITDADLSNAAFPWFAAREIQVGSTPVRALRINFVGELGWELHHPVEYQVGLYEAIKGAGEDVGLVDFGLRAMDSLRLEKAYRAWGADINTEVTPLEAGLERFVAFDKGDFIGRDALLRQRHDGVRKRLATLEVDAADADCWGNEAVWAGDRVVGITHVGRLRVLARSKPGRGLRRCRGRGARHAPGRRDPGRPPPGGRPRRAPVRPGEPPAPQLTIRRRRPGPEPASLGANGALDRKSTTVLTSASCRRAPRLAEPSWTTPSRSPPRRAWKG